MRLPEAYGSLPPPSSALEPSHPLRGLIHTLNFSSKDLFRQIQHSRLQIQFLLDHHESFFVSKSSEKILAIF